MNRNSRNNEMENDLYVNGLRKVRFWEKYGVQRFPYRGRRRYTPFVNRSVDGGIIISNYVFGLTIRQFDQMFKSCLNRRKAQEQYILNLRYPDKSSDEYLEYLQYSTDCNTGYVSWPRKDLKERYLYEHFVNKSGTEKDIRKRQQLFITQDMIQNEFMLNIGAKMTVISSGSLAEDLDLPGSDRDIMYVFEDVDVIRDVKNIKHSVQRTTLAMETDNEHPGFTNLRLIAEGEGDSFSMPPKSFESIYQWTHF